MIIDLDENAEQELKRADHLIYVTLKYTRTIDVIKNIIKRLITAYDFAILELLNYLKVKPSQIPRVRAQQLKKKKTSLRGDMEFYLFLRKLNKANYTKKEEYRKHVTMITKYAKVDIPTLEEYLKKTKEFVSFVREIIHKKKKR